MMTKRHLEEDKMTECTCNKIPHDPKCSLVLMGERIVRECLREELVEEENETVPGRRGLGRYMRETS